MVAAVSYFGDGGNDNNPIYMGSEQPLNIGNLLFEIVVRVADGYIYTAYLHGGFDAAQDTRIGVFHNIRKQNGHVDALMGESQAIGSMIGHIRAAAVQGIEIPFGHQFIYGAVNRGPCHQIALTELLAGRELAVRAALRCQFQKRLFNLLIAKCQFLNTLPQTSTIYTKSIRMYYH